MARFHSLKVHDIIRETPDAVSIGLSIPAELRGDFAFQAGQYLTLKLQLKGQEVRRSYSICSAPFQEGPLRIAVKKVKGGSMSSYLVDELKAGATLEVMVPMGGFTTPFDAAQARHLVAFAGGSGITPVLSILQTLLKEEPNSRFTLFYGNSDADRVIFKTVLDQLQQDHAGRFRCVLVIDAPERSGGGLFGMFRGKAKAEVDTLHTGLMTRERIAALLDAYVTDELPKRYFTCGPLPMMENVAMELERRGVPKELVHLELFTSPVTTAPAAEASPAPVAAGADKAQVVVTLDGATRELVVPFKGAHILDVAADAGMDVPYSCKGGVCSTCRAKVLEGKVEMDMNYALTDGEVAAGYILTCQSHPRTPRVVIDFDQP